jgi:hypothetical protein
MSCPNDTPKQAPPFEHFAQKAETRAHGLASRPGQPTNGPTPPCTGPLGWHCSARRDRRLCRNRQSRKDRRHRLARAFHGDLFHLDLAAVVSKFIGETEKNLDKIFNSAEMDGAIPFFSTKLTPSSASARKERTLTSATPTSKLTSAPTHRAISRHRHLGRDYHLQWASPIRSVASNPLSTKPVLRPDRCQRRHAPLASCWERLRAQVRG